LLYVDPGTGSIIVQLIAGGIAAGAVAGKLWWRRILSLLHLRRSDDAADRPPR
jgi:hypothetical protein